MNRRLVEAIVASFREAAIDVHFARIASFDSQAWARTYSWLDASGLALYFLSRLKSLHIEDALPAGVLSRLETNTADNRDRTSEMFAEFIRINQAFQDGGLSYVNLKGFTLVPDACPDAVLRCQFDLDFAMAHTDVLRCEEILKRQGYRLVGVDKYVREFKAGSSQVPSVRDLYKISSQRSLEVHFFEVAKQGNGSSRGGQLCGAQSRNWDGLELPVLSDRDRFIGLALHLFKHLRGEWTRISWIFEYASYVNFHHGDDVLWREVREWLLDEPDARVAVGAATLIADRTFSIPSLPPALTWTVQELPGPVRLWIERYGNKVVLAKFPGTKLYLLLQKVLDQDVVTSRNKRRRKLFPFHRPQKISHPVAGEPWLQRFKAIVTEVSYVVFRLRFHLECGIFYVIEASRWKKYIAEQQG
jgi:hypothetical protein